MNCEKVKDDAQWRRPTTWRTMAMNWRIQ